GCPPAAAALGQHRYQRSSRVGRPVRGGARRPLYHQHDAEGTLKAVADHGVLTGILSADGGDSEEVLARFAKSGVEVEALATKLQDEGAKSFVASWRELVGVIAFKTAALDKDS